MGGRCSLAAKDFYSPREIVFTRVQVLWVIQNLVSLRDGDKWPTEESGYTDDIPIGKRVRGRQAPFITAAECYIEMSTRLEKCGIDGLILLAIECWGESEQSLSKYLGIPEWSVRERYKRALAYVASGPARRWHNTKKREGENYDKFKIRKKKK